MKETASIKRNGAVWSFAIIPKRYINRGKRTKAQKVLKKHRTYAINEKE